MPEFPDREKVLSWIDTKWSESRFCPICGQTNWIINIPAGAMLSQNEKGVFVPYEIYPFYSVYCKNCGYTRLFNPLIMGFFKNDEQTPSSDIPVPSEKSGAERKI